LITDQKSVISKAQLRLGIKSVITNVGVVNLRVLRLVNRVEEGPASCPQTRLDMNDTPPTSTIFSRLARLVSRLEVRPATCP
jgi:hypothetical protein